jgi:hypothetical protein
MYDGLNIVVVDVETLRSAEDCLRCARPREDHSLAAEVRFAHACPGYEPIGWDRKGVLGLAIGCAFDYQDMALHWFDAHTLDAQMRQWVARQCLLVTYNGLNFDGPLLRAVLRSRCAPDTPEHAVLMGLCNAFKALCLGGYDLLQAIWERVPREARGRGRHTLDAMSQANGYGTKPLTGVEAPRLWAQGRIAEVLDYCAGDVTKTRQLFEQVQQTGMLQTSDGGVLELRRALLPPH